MPPLVRLNAHIIVEVINTAVTAAAAKAQSDAASGAATPTKSNVRCPRHICVGPLVECPTPAPAPGPGPPIMPRRMCCDVVWLVPGVRLRCVR